MSGTFVTAGATLGMPPPPVHVATSAPARGDVLSAFLRPCRMQCLRAQFWRLTAATHGSFFEVGPGFLGVVAGTGLLRVAGDEADVVLRPSDFAFLTCAREFTLLRGAGNQGEIADRRPNSAIPAPHSAKLGAGRGGDLQFFWAALSDDDEYTRQAFSLLPPLVKAGPQSDGGAGGLSPLLALLLDEFENRRPGGEFLIERALHGMLVYALRTTSLTMLGEEGLLPALGTPGLGTALGGMHARPEHDWSVRELAELAGLSRSKFALRFVEVMGRPPVDYLREIRLRLACQLLRETNRGIKEIAARVGYATEASFGKAFVRWHGCTPGAYRHRTERSCDQ